MTSVVSFQGKPWQNTLIGSTKKLNALFNDGYFSDLTITFPGKKIRYKTHKVILAMSSSIFEKILFGPMAITGSELELPDDNPEVFRIVLAHCYEVSIEPSDIDEALQLYMLADKYFLEELIRVCTQYISRNLNRENIVKVFKFSTNYNFDSLEEECRDLVMYSPQILLGLSEKWLNKLLDSGVYHDLVFEESWQNPIETLQEDAVIQILNNESFKHEGLGKIAGCVSAKVVSIICSDQFAKKSKHVKPELYLSFTNAQHANEIFSRLDVKYIESLCIHLQCKTIAAERLRKIPVLKNLFLSNVDDNGIDWVMSVIGFQNPPYKSYGPISFPRSKLTLSGLKILLKQLTHTVFAEVKYPVIRMYSPELPSSMEYELRKWIKLNKTRKNEYLRVILYDSNNDIDGWDPLTFY